MKMGMADLQLPTNKHRFCLRQDPTNFGQDIFEVELHTISPATIIAHQRTFAPRNL